MNDHSVRPNHVLHLIIKKVGLCDAYLVPCVHSESPRVRVTTQGNLETKVAASLSLGMMVSYEYDT